MASQMGADASIHVVKQWVARSSGSSGNNWLKRYFDNAVKPVSRDVALAEARRCFPPIAGWACWGYGMHTSSWFGGGAISSESGVQQGGPLCPLVLACAAHQTALQLSKLLRSHPRNGSAGLCLFSLDIRILCGDALAVSVALRVTLAESSRLGLTLQLSKRELVLAGSPSADLACLFTSDFLTDPRDRSDRVVRDGHFESLGAPVGSATLCQSEVEKQAM